MPVYEFYCADCHVVFNFLSKRINTEKRPSCPRCGRPELERKVSGFALSLGMKEAPADTMPNVDEGRLEQAMSALAGQMEGMDENDPRQMASFMRKFTDLAGMNLAGDMEEAIRRLEAGEDPEKIEAEMGDLLNEENPFAGQGISSLKKRLKEPDRDETLYEM